MKCPYCNNEMVLGVKDLLSKFNIDLPKKGTSTDGGKELYTISFDLDKSGDV